MNSRIAFWNILKKDIRNYYLKPPNISWGIIFPLSWTLMQLIRSPGQNVLELLPGLISMAFYWNDLVHNHYSFKGGRAFEQLRLRSA